MSGYTAVLKDVNGVPIGEVYPPGSTGNTVALKGSFSTTTDAANNTSAAAAVSPEDGSKPTYSVSIIGLVPAASPTDVFTITGSASEVVRITRVEVTGVATTAGTVDLVLLKRSTANTLGTSTNPTKVAHDSADSASTATVNAYTVNPTTGTLVGNFRAGKLFLALATALSDKFVQEWGIRPSKAIVLRGIAEVFAINLNGVTAPAGTALDISIEYTKE